MRDRRILPAWQLLTAGILITAVSACSGADEESGETSRVDLAPILTSQPQTPTLTKKPISTTAVPEDPFDTSMTTRIPPTRRQTNTPTITPTFDVSSVRRATPGIPATCPEANPAVYPDFIHLPEEELRSGRNNEVEDYILEYLNAGGDIEKFNDYSYDYSEIIFGEVDLTNDSVPETVVLFPTFFPILLVYKCQDGEYQLILYRGSTYIGIGSNGLVIETSTDMNLNSVPELVLWEITCSNGGCLDAYIYEWDGEKLRRLTKNLGDKDIPWGITADMSGHTLDSYFPQIELRDIDRNGTIEMILSGGIPGNMGDYYLYGPWREETKIFMWNGEEFALHSEEISAPEYRYQAIQDGDRETLKGDYETALKLYQDAIFSDLLKPWTPELKTRQQELLWFVYNDDPTPTPPIINSDIYYQLAAYARFRIMLLYLLQGHEQEAQVVYETLLEKYPEGNPGYLYTQMAAAFWEAYQERDDIGEGCAAAVLFATMHEDILAPLGSGYHSWQDHTYVADDVCPFS